MFFYMETGKGIFFTILQFYKRLTGHSEKGYQFQNSGHTV